MTAIGQVFLYCAIVQLFVQVAGKNITQCLEGQDRDNLTITCFSIDTPYIDIKNVTMGAVLLTNVCNENANKSQCCETAGACRYSNKTLHEELFKLCSGNTICKKELWSPSLTEICDTRIHFAKATFILVEYECLPRSPLTTPSTTTTNTSYVVTPTAILTYSSNLTMGEQAAIICCIMLFLFLICTAVIIYKRIKYGPPEDVRKLFSRPAPENTDSPSVTPWVAAEAEEQIYKSIVEKSNKKKKRRFPKLKF